MRKVFYDFSHFVKVPTCLEQNNSKVETKDNRFGNIEDLMPNIIAGDKGNIIKNNSLDKKPLENKDFTSHMKTMLSQKTPSQSPSKSKE